MTVELDDKGRIYTNVITKQPIRVIIETVNQQIIGNLHVRPGERVIDELNRGETFVAITSAVVTEKSGQELYRCNFLALNHKSITWIIPEKDLIPPSIS
ncbi:MAG: hypothetical protein M1281_09400 [Chloroflexi bacterium]|nr:hypothetical protein [Chloroflexota bacterium]